MATGCVKIVKKSSEFDSTGKFIPKEKRSESVDLFKGSKISGSTNEDSCQRCQSTLYLFVYLLN